MKIAVALLFSLVVAFGQTGRTVTLSWDDLLNPTGTTYNIYRANGACTGTPSYVSIASGIALKTYDNTGMSPGKYCYAVTAVFGGEESDKSIPSMAQVKPHAPTNLRNVLAELIAWLGDLLGQKPLRVKVN